MRLTTALKPVFFVCFTLVLLISTSFSATITVNPTQGQKEINPHIYGRNNNLRATSGGFHDAAEQNLAYEAGVKFMREGQGNNSTKYNWKLKLSSHPDWYNNVYTHDWDSAAILQQNSFPDADAMYSLQVAGMVAVSDSCNYDESANDPNYTMTSENMACGGDISKYLKAWPADSTVGILDHWFGPGGLGLNKDQFRIWNLDNEPELWGHGHDDIYPDEPHPDTVVTKYIAVASAAKAAHPDIELAGPAFTNEWQWWTFGRDSVNYEQGWMKYFIDGMGEASQTTGVQLLDYVDFHQYPTFDGSATGQNSVESVLQSHRDWYDTNYHSPWANGIRSTSLYNWTEPAVRKVFVRTQEWIDEAFGPNNTVGMGISECGFFGSGDPSGDVVANWYASHLGTFADHGLDYFTPWMWYPGMYEVLHLFTSKAGDIRVHSGSDNDSLVSAYSSLNRAGDLLTVILVNRDVSNSQSTTVNLEDFSPSASSVSAWQLNDLGATETFAGKSNNALEETSIALSGSSLTLDLPTLSITAVQIPTSTPIPLSSTIDPDFLQHTKTWMLHDRNLTLTQDASIQIFALNGRLILQASASAGKSFSLRSLDAGSYVLRINSLSHLVVLH